MKRKYLVLHKVEPQFKAIGDKLAVISKEYCDRWGYQFFYEYELRNRNWHYSLDPIEAILYYLQSDYDFEWLYQYGSEGVCNNHTITLDEVLDSCVTDEHNIFTMYNAVLPIKHPLPFFRKENNEYKIDFLNEPKPVIVNSLFIKRCDWSINLFKQMKNDTGLQTGIISMLPNTLDRFEIGLQIYYDLYPELRKNWCNVPITDYMSFPDVEGECFNALKKDMALITPEHKKYNPTAWISIIGCTSSGDTTQETLARIANLEKKFIK